MNPLPQAQVPDADRDTDDAAAPRRTCVPHPLPYQGSKRLLARIILKHCPRHVSRFVEPFAGSAAMSLAAAFHDRADSMFINDANAPLAALWTEIIERPEELSAEYTRHWLEQLGQERAYYDALRDEFNHTHQPELLLFLLARCVKAAVRYNAKGEFNNSPDNRRRGIKPERLREQIVGASQLFAGRTRVTAQDYREVLAACNSSDVIYLDPPYQGVGTSKDGRYGAKVEHSEFCDALDALNRRACRFLVSYDGQTGGKSYGSPLPAELRLTHMELPAGRSSQATLLGKASETIESLYLSSALVASM